MKVEKDDWGIFILGFIFGMFFAGVLFNLFNELL